MTFNTSGVNHDLRDTIFYERLHHFTQIDSTNTRALSDAQDGAEAGQVYLADEQTAGRGRGGHTWHSEPDRGLYMTVLVRPKIRAEDALKLSLMAGIAAFRAIQRVTGFHIDLRWPNDLVVPGALSRKLGGILTESASSPDGRLRHAAIGIGINLNQAAFSAELKDRATSLRLATGQTVSREAIATALLLALDAGLKQIETPEGPAEILRNFSALSSWANGKRVHVSEDEGYTGLTEGLTATGLLRVRCTDETVRVVRHGGVREILSQG